MTVRPRPAPPAIRRAVASLIVALELAAASAAVAAPPPRDVGVLINGTAVVFDQAPLDRDGRIYVPLRGIFERLGASVVFAAGRIAAVAGKHRVSLAIGEPTATVDGVAQSLDAPAIVVAGRALVPLRFVSQALGATVAYDAAARTVAVTAAPFARATPTAAAPIAIASAAASPAAAASEPPPSPTPEPVRAAIALRPGETPIAIRLLRREPVPGTTVAQRRPEISATFGETVDPATVRVVLDGADVTSRAAVSPRSLTIDPPSDLAPGSHEISLAGRTPDRDAFAGRWTFATREGADTNVLAGLEPANGIALGSLSFTVSGYTRPRARVRIDATTSGTSDAFVDPGDASLTVDAVADAKGFFEAPFQLVDRGAGIVDVRVTSTAPGGDVAVRTLRLRR